MFVSGPVGTSVTGTGLAAIVRSHEVDCALASGAALRGRQRRAVDAAVAVHVGRHDQLAHERPVGAGRDRDVAPPGEVEHAHRVRRRLRERLVPVHGGDAEQLDLRTREREQQRDRVVVARIAVEDDGMLTREVSGRRPRSRRFSSLTVAGIDREGLP